MKSAYYAAVVTNAYRHALDAAIAGKPLDKLFGMDERPKKVSHRPYTTGLLLRPAGQHYAEELSDGGRRRRRCGKL